MWIATLAQEAAAGGGPNLSLADAAVYYGIASPFITYLLWDGRQKDKAKKDADERINALTERLLDQQGEALPLLHEATQTLATATAQLASHVRRDGDGTR